MILFLNTSTPVCLLMIEHDGDSYHYEWEAGRALSKGLLGFIQNSMGQSGSEWDELTGLVVYKGPGSFTGLRIGISVINALASARSIPVVGVTGDEWQTIGRDRLARGESDIQALPEYGADANITTPRK